MKFLTDVHNHSDFSFDGQAPLAEMLSTALKKGVSFYGVSEHFDYDVFVRDMAKDGQTVTDAEAYFHTARHLQEDYAGILNVLVGGEFSYDSHEKVAPMYKAIVEKYAPDFIVNSVHTRRGDDYWLRTPYYDHQGVLREKDEVYAEYLQLVRESLDVPYPYDIVGHMGYVVRYGPYADKTLSLRTHERLITDILQTVIDRGKIIEINPKVEISPQRDILELYFALGGRKVSYASDAHAPEQIMYRREEVVHMLRDIGFTHISVPCRGEHIQVEL